MKVLFLEDDVGVAGWAKPALEFMAGVEEVELVTSNFRQLFHEERWEGVDVFLTDWMVPNFNVRRLLEWLQEHKPNIRRVVYTALDEYQVDHGGFADQVVLKSGSFEELTKALRGG